MINFALNILLTIRMQYIKFTIWRVFVNATQSPRKAQLKLLKHIIKSQKHTKYGQENNFNAMHSYKDYQKHVALNSYEDLRYYIEQQDLTKIPYINSQPHLFYSITSGTTSKPKLIPITKRAINLYKKSQMLTSYIYYMQNKSIVSGKIMSIISPEIEGTLKSGLHFGSMSGFLYNQTSKLIKHKYAIPNIIFTIENYDAKYYYISLFALHTSEISLIVTANPSTILKISKTISTHAQMMIQEIEQGKLENRFNLSDSIFEEIQILFKAHPQRAIELKKLFRPYENPSFVKIWSSLQALIMWTQGSVGATINTLKNTLLNTPVYELGYVASELRGSINISPSNTLCVPTIHDVFFEFIKCENFDNGNYAYQLIDELEIGEKYYVIITTYYGLYRYFMNDIIEVDGYYQQTPTIKFLQKGQGVTNITGEKLYENQLIDAIKELETHIHSPIEFFIMIADDKKSAYTLFLQTNATNINIAGLDFDTILGKYNLEYQSKIASGRLHSTHIILLCPNAYENYKKFLLASGQREGQFKYLSLQTKQNIQYDFYQDAI